MPGLINTESAASSQFHSNWLHTENTYPIVTYGDHVTHVSGFIIFMLLKIIFRKKKVYLVNQEEITADDSNN